MLFNSYCNNTSLQSRLSKNMNQSSYKLSTFERETVCNIVEDLLAKQLIRKSESQSECPTILVCKKEGSY